MKLGNGHCMHYMLCENFFFLSHVYHYYQLIFNSKTMTVVSMTDKDLMRPVMALVMLESALQVARYLVAPSSVQVLAWFYACFVEVLLYNVGFS